MSTQTEEITKTIAFLKFDTIRDSLKFAKCKSQGPKPVLVKNYETAVLDVGIDKFVERLSPELIEFTAKLINVTPAANQDLKQGLTSAIQTAGLGSVLNKSDEDLLKKFSGALGLEEEAGGGGADGYAKKIEDEVMLIGMEGFLQGLSPELLRKHCVELNLPKAGQKSDLVEKLMVHIFELEPLNGEKKEGPPQVPPPQEKAAQDKEKEEAKPKENKKRKAEPKEKKAPKQKKTATTTTTTTTTTTAAAATDKKEETPTQRPKRSATTKKKDDDSDAEEAHPPKKQKKEATSSPPQDTTTTSSPKKAKKPKDSPKTPRAPYVSPPLSTLVKGAYSPAELHNKFNLVDLQKYAKQEGLKSAGQKKNLIKRIAHYLETGEKEDLKKEKKGRGRKKGPAAAAKADGSTKEKAKGGKKKKAAKEDKEKGTAGDSTAETKPAAAAETKA